MVSVFHMRTTRLVGKLKILLVILLLHLFSLLYETLYLDSRGINDVKSALTYASTHEKLESETETSITLTESGT